MGNNLSESVRRSTAQADDHMDFEEITLPDHYTSGCEAAQLPELTPKPAENASDDGGVDDEERLGVVSVDLESVKVADALKHGPRPLDHSADAWIWSKRFQDFIQKGDDGRLLRYTVYQRPGETLDFPDPNEASDLSSVFCTESDSCYYDSDPDDARSTQSVVPRPPALARSRRHRKPAKKRKGKKNKSRPGCTSEGSSSDSSTLHAFEGGSAKRELSDKELPSRGLLSENHEPDASNLEDDGAGTLSSENEKSNLLPKPPSTSPTSLTPSHPPPVQPKRNLAASDQQPPIPPASPERRLPPQPSPLSTTAPLSANEALARRFQGIRSMHPRRPLLPLPGSPSERPAADGTQCQSPSRGRALQRFPAGQRAPSPRDGAMPPARQSSIESWVIPERPSPSPPFFQRGRADYEIPLDTEFRVVEQPRRFFQNGRIFMTVWFESESRDPSRTLSSMQWHDACPPFREIRPYAAFRWFLVVRKKTTHSLCFSITTRAVSSDYPSRGTDQCVLYSALVDPPTPSPNERIVSGPLSVIVEHKGKFISPTARVDLSRVYTVEHNLKVMKLGRVHRNSLATLEEHYRRAVA